MYKSFPILILLFVANSVGVMAQATKNKGQLTDNQNPTNSAPIAPTARKEQSSTAQHLYSEGIKLTEEGQLSQAVEELQQAVRMDPEYAEAYAALGRAYFKMRQWQNAVDCFRRASELKTKQRASQNAVRQRVAQPESKGAKIEMNPAPANLHSAVPPVKPFKSGPSTSFTTPSPTNAQSKKSEKTNEVVVAAKSPSTVVGMSGHKDKLAEENIPKTQQGVAPTQTNTDVAAVKPLNSDKQEKTDPTPTSQQSAIPQPVKPFNSGSSTSFTTPSPNNAQSKQSEKTNEVVVAAKSPSTVAGMSGHKDKQAEENIRKTQQGVAPTQTNTDVAAVKPLNSDKQEKTDPTPTSQPSAIPPEAGTNLAAVKSPNLESRTAQPEPPADGPPALKTNVDTAEPTKEAAGVKVAMSVTPSSTPLESKSVAPTPINTSSDEKLLTKIYRVGPNDVLDVQIDGTESPRSTLFTVTSAGFLEHPM
ncbi:MAG TPA: tetratricopeptide repeat protein, partial [Pyrinomonadaceae bacterium]|nr:tetratricopeptide repeat protein [Pyrinomonadaceae bacterium]